MDDSGIEINGVALKLYRQSLRMDRGTLAKSCGKTEVWIRRMEKGKGNASFAINSLELYRLAAALGIKPDDLTVDAEYFSDAPSANRSDAPAGGSR